MPFEIKIHALQRKMWKVKDMCTTLYQTRGGFAHSFSSKKKRETSHGKHYMHRIHGKVMSQIFLIHLRNINLL
jgi:hypothetical protein